MQSLNKNNNEKTVNDYVDLIETLARVEYNRLSFSVHLIDYSELVNIGAIAVHIILTKYKGKEYNTSYMSTAIKWAIRNELRRRYKWYSFKHSSNKDETKGIFESSEDVATINRIHVREAIYQSILSIDELAEGENPTQVKDSSLNPAESLELRELNNAIKKAMKNLPPREKMVLEDRFFKHKKIKELATEMKISSSRVSRIVQSGLDKIRAELKKQGLIEYHNI